MNEWANLKGDGSDRAIIDLMLAHVPDGKVEAAYNRAAYMPRRRKIAQIWADAWRPLIAEASLRFGVPAAWIERVMRAESGGRTALGGRPITSHAGAMGLMQLMPGTWAEMRRAYDLGGDPHDPRDNIIAGTAYLRRMYDWFGYPGLFAAYNAGPSRYAAHLTTGRALPGETRAYLAAVAGTRSSTETLPGARSADRLFVALQTRGRPASPAPSDTPTPGLFVTLSQR